MPPPALPPPVLIKTPTDLQKLAARLERQEIIAVDTESNSLHAYQEKVCLLQFGLPGPNSAGEDLVLDALAVRDLSILAGVFASPKIEKIFHAAEYDLICLKRDFGFEFSNVFDTMVAARTLGWRKVGLASILEQHFGVIVNKRFQRADWGRRPLSPEQLAYARLDTHYLIPLRDQMRAELVAADRWEEACEEFERLAHADNIADAAGGYDSRGFWRINGARDLTPRELAVLRELYNYRDDLARRMDRPPFKVMGDKTLMEIARRLPLTAQKLKDVHGMTPGQLRRHQRGILDAVRRGNQAPPPHPPRVERLPDEVLARYEALHAWRKKCAARRQVESDVIVPRDVLWELARRAPRTLQELTHIPGLMPWRRERYGPEILRVLNP
ncbi:MAG: HRDC domain-containing protein [Chloroflexi bacterium]|nr:HRDC domain-containing protein [Chloroflexota bacterium]